MVFYRYGVIRKKMSKVQYRKVIYAAIQKASSHGSSGAQPPVPS